MPIPLRLKKKCNKRTFRKEHLINSFMFFTILKFTTATLREPVTAFLLSQFILLVTIVSTFAYAVVAAMYSRSFL